MEEKAKMIAEILKLVSNENRLLILCALLQEPMTVTKIASHIPNITQSALSQHLLILKTAGLLSSKKEGQNVTYTIVDQRIIEVMATLKKQYC